MSYRTNFKHINKQKGQTEEVVPVMECTFMKNGKPIGGVTTEGVVIIEQVEEDEPNAE